MKLRHVCEQLSTNLVGRIGPLDVTLQVFTIFFLYLHVRKLAKYVNFILVLDPQVNCLPVEGGLTPEIIGVIQINRDVRFEKIWTT